MNLSGEQRIPASRQEVWEALNEPDVLRAAIPGCQSLEQDGPDRFSATVEVKIGPIGARFKGAVGLSEIDAPNGYVISGQGSGGIAGNAKGVARVRLTDDGVGTLLSYSVEAEVGGRMAQLGGPIIDATAKQLAGKFFAKFGEIVAGELPPTAQQQPTPSPHALPQAARSAVSESGMPWAWLTALTFAIIAGFMLGRSDAADWWVIGMVVLSIAAAVAGYESGRRSGGSR